MSKLTNENLLKSYEELNKEYEEETTKLSQVINLLKKMVNLVENGSQEKIHRKSRKSSTFSKNWYGWNN